MSSRSTKSNSQNARVSNQVAIECGTSGARCQRSRNPRHSTSLTQTSANTYSTVEVMEVGLLPITQYLGSFVTQSILPFFRPD